MNRLHWRKHFIGDHMMLTARLSLAEQGAYVRMLDLQWLHGPLPEATTLARLVGSGATAKMVERLLAQFFEQTPEGWVCAELEDGRRKAEEEVEKRRRAGQAGAAGRWQKDGNRNADANGNRNARAYGNPDPAPDSLPEEREGTSPAPDAEISPRFASGRGAA